MYLVSYVHIILTREVLLPSCKAVTWKNKSQHCLTSRRTVPLDLLFLKLPSLKSATLTNLREKRRRWCFEGTRKEVVAALHPVEKPRVSPAGMTSLVLDGDVCARSYMFLNFCTCHTMPCKTSIPIGRWLKSSLRHFADPSFVQRLF